MIQTAEKEKVPCASIDVSAAPIPLAVLIPPQTPLGQQGTKKQETKSERRHPGNSNPEKTFPSSVVLTFPRYLTLTY